MNAQKHTPGPWRVTEDGYIAGCGYVPIRTPFRADAFKDGPGRSDHPEEVLAANAYLIAAAPEMLEILSALVGEADTTGGARREVSRYEIDRARAVVKKAKGEWKRP